MHASGASRAGLNLPGDGVGTEVFWIDEERPSPGAVVLSVHGDADLHVVARLRDQLAEVIDRDPGVLVLDLSHASFLDSTAIAVLLRAMKRMHARGGRFRLVVPRSDLRRVFELTLLDRVFALDATLQEALAAPKDGRRDAAPL